MTDDPESNLATPGPGPSTTANKRAANVTTTIVGQDGIDSARVGACSNCRSRKIKCSGDRPICKTCAKNGQSCEYPLHVSRKRKDRDSSSRRPTEGYKRSVSASDQPQVQFGGNVGDLGILQHQSNNFFPTFDFGIDPIALQSQSDPAGLPVDNAWLENFLAYDFGNAMPPAQGLAQPIGPGGQAGVTDGQAAVNAASTTSSGIGEGGSKGKHKAKFRVPYFRYVLALRYGVALSLADDAGSCKISHISEADETLTMTVAQQPSLLAIARS